MKHFALSFGKPEPVSDVDVVASSLNFSTEQTVEEFGEFVADPIAPTLFLIRTGNRELYEQIVSQAQDVEVPVIALCLPGYPVDDVQVEAH